MRKSKTKPYGKLPSLERHDITKAVMGQLFGSLGFVTPRDHDLLSFFSEELDPCSFSSPGEFLPWYWAHESFSKHPFELGVDRKGAAKAAFLAAEVRCTESNSQLVDSDGRTSGREFRDITLSARRLLAGLLSGISREEVVQRAAWGPGASTSLPRRMSSHQNKWVLASHVTHDALPWALAFKRWSSQPLPELLVVEGNKVTTVPKNAKTERTIAIEPDWNMFFQLGLGGAIRSRLNRVGLLRADGQERNKLLAKVGSLTSAFATIDLKAASDTVSLALCDLLLPPRLFQMILELRSPLGSYEGETVTYEKVSSMGNGFTFELETALFWAISSAVAGVDTAVYGDDIVVPTESAPRVIAAMNYYGFEVNMKKSFIAGPFRESCGGHYFMGKDVTPPYFRKPINSLPEFIRAGNTLGQRIMHCDLGLSHDLAELRWNLFGSNVPRQFYGPPTVSDGVYHTTFDRAVPRWLKRYQCYTGPALISKRKLIKAPEMGSLISALWGATHVERHPSVREVITVGYWYADRGCFASQDN